MENFNIKVVNMPNDQERFMVLDAAHGEVLEDAQGMGFKTEQKALNTWNQRSEKSKRRKLRQISHRRDWFADDALRKLVDSVQWSCLMADGSDWSNIFWNRKTLIEYAGFDINDQRALQTAYRKIKDYFQDNRDQMYLYGYKDNMPQSEIEQEVGHTSKLRRFVLNAQTGNPVLEETHSLWRIDGSVSSGWSTRSLPEFNNLFDTFNDAKQAFKKFVSDNQANIVKEFKLSDYAFGYNFKTGERALIVIYPLGNEKLIENALAQNKLAKK